ncbi:MAG: hypothetical protein KAS63_02480 [Candidatus Heimdallarchaeota archaeon]|nr:hypothetical protein [Candidatus Heimdallarchaeota archaeon]MCK4954203.1 hypothetical protein [Candidatus Heimdallarchaeota archaeon]
MNTRHRIYLIFFLSIGIIFLIIALVQNQHIAGYDIFSNFTSEQVQDFLNTYTTGFPRPWAP